MELDMNSTKHKPSSLDQEPAEGSRRTIDQALKRSTQDRQGTSTAKEAAGHERDGAERKRK
jgi:hypothetical protein